MRESRQVLEWQQEARVETLQENVLMMLGSQLQLEMPEDVRRTVKNQENLDVLREWLRATGQVDPLDEFRAILQADHGNDETP